MKLNDFGYIPLDPEQLIQTIVNDGGSFCPIHIQTKHHQDDTWLKVPLSNLDASTVKVDVSHSDVRVSGDYVLPIVFEQVNGEGLEQELRSTVTHTIPLDSIDTNHCEAVRDGEDVIIKCPTQS